MRTAIHVVLAASEAAFHNYTSALSELALPSGSQLSLLEAMNAANRVVLWRDIWRCCLIESARRELAAVAP